MPETHPVTPASTCRSPSPSAQMGSMEIKTKIPKRTQPSSPLQRKANTPSTLTALHIMKKRSDISHFCKIPKISAFTKESQYEFIISRIRKVQTQFIAHR